MIWELWSPECINILCRNNDQTFFSTKIKAFGSNISFSFLFQPRRRPGRGGLRGRPPNGKGECHITQVAMLLSFQPSLWSSDTCPAWDSRLLLLINMQANTYTDARAYTHTRTRTHTDAPHAWCMVFCLQRQLLVQLRPEDLSFMACIRNADILKIIWIYNVNKTPIYPHATLYLNRTDVWSINQNMLNIVSKISAQ